MELKSNTPLEGAEVASAPDVLQLSRYMTERSPLPIVATTNATHTVGYANEAFCRLVGKAREELIGQEFTLAVPEVQENGCALLLDKVYRTGESETLAEQQHTQSTVTPVYWSYTVWAVLDAEERPCGLMIQIVDTSEATRNRQLLAAISQALMLTSVELHELLELSEVTARRLRQAMRETDHRVKNNLQAISSLLDMQTMTDAETVPVRELIQIRAYIKILSIVHDMLVQDVRNEPTGSTMSVKMALQKLLPMLHTVAGKNRVVWYADDVRLPVNQGISLTVMVNELVSNGIKHGGNTVEVRLTATNRTVNLEVLDDGPGFPADFDPARASNYGLELVESVCRVDLKGVTVYENRPEGGASVRVSFPLPAGVN